ncbi:MAG: indole-3-glycerol-phosphate synthase [archaeon]|nr:indole-3-glycerol-phosphate synthase [archaeon]
MITKVNAILEQLTQNAFKNVESGYYNVLASDSKWRKVNRRTLSDVIKDNKKSHNASLVCEIKFSSPSAGAIRSDRTDPVTKIAKEMREGGAHALSVLTENKNFNGSLSNLIAAHEATQLPVIMKDIIVSPKQIEAASKIGANAILLIYELFEKDLTRGFSLGYALTLAHSLGLEAIVETSSERGLERLLGLGGDGLIDVIGINNRDLETFEVTIDKTIALLSEFSEELENERRVLLMSESGYEEPPDITRVLKTCRYSPDAFLIGTSIMRSDNIQSKVRDFANALQREEEKI